ncbi:MAG: hypothetical protein HC811_10910 [Flammeovirgaceae bacterium]|nr:hypothetical protein [Flammeovirgaceae bacterium]
MFESYQQIPANISSSDKLVYYYYLLNGYCEATGYDSSWKPYEDNRLFAARRFLPYVNEDD